MVMLAKRIVPTILCRGRNLVKGRQFAGDRVIGNVVQAVRIHQMREVDELVLLDIGKGLPDLAMIEELASYCFMPLTVGGGIHEVSQAVELIRRGADKVVIKDHRIIAECADRLGSQAIVASVDHRPGMDSLTHAKDCEQSGAGEILLQSVERDGTMTGYDLELIKTVSNAVNVPVIASGGCKGYPDMAEAFNAGADAVAVGALFQFTDSTPAKAANYLKSLGYAVREPRNVGSVGAVAAGELHGH